MDSLCLTRDQLIPGVWDDDIKNHPDDVYRFLDEQSQYSCQISRNRLAWNWNGYVQLPADHPDFKKSKQQMEDVITVHGSITYGNDGKFGFDTRHMLQGDISPSDETNILRHPNLFPRVTPLIGKPHYWTFEEVKDEVIGMAAQFKRREGPFKRQDDAFKHQEDAKATDGPKQAVQSQTQTHGPKQVVQSRAQTHGPKQAVQSEEHASLSKGVLKGGCSSATGEKGKEGKEDKKQGTASGFATALAGAFKDKKGLF